MYRLLPGFVLVPAGPLWRQLHRKLKALVNRSPAEHLRMYRLHRAAEVLRGGESPSSVAFATEFNSQSHFGACFKALFNETPGASNDFTS